MRMLKSQKSLGPANSLVYWHRVKNPLRIMANFLVIYSARYSPSLALKRFAYRLLGAKIGKNVSPGLSVIIDVFYPELIEIGDNTIIGYGSTILAHEFLIKELKTGKVKIGKNVMIGSNCTILAGVTIGDGAVVSSMSLVNRDVKPGEFVGGIPIKKLKRRKR